jgi:hypothetical protein
MRIHSRLWTAIAAFFLSLIGSLLAWILFGAALPIWFMQWLVGAEDLHGAPAHGAAILFVTVPLGGMLALLILVGMTAVIYDKLTPR